MSREPVNDARHSPPRADLVGVVLGLAAVAAACGPARPDPASRPAPVEEVDTAARAAPRVVQPGAPGEPSRAVEPGTERGDRRAHTAADVSFMRDMIVHHEQALHMAALVPDRTERQEIRSLAARIAASQEAEIAMMRRWLAARGLSGPGEAGDSVAGRDPAHAAHAGHPTPEGPGTMAGMATAEELARLERASGDAFDRLFLELMIRHHEGALDMVAERAERGGSDPEVHIFAGHVDADQRAEIARMRRLQDVPFQ